MKYTQFIFLNLIFMSGLVADENNTVGPKLRVTNLTKLLQMT